MAIKSEKLTFEGAGGDQLAARLDLPAGEPKAYALFAHCFTCSKDIFAAAKHPKSFISLDDADHLLSRKADAVYVARVLAAWAGRISSGARTIGKRSRIRASTFGSM